jgi:hypothetical protein
MVRDCVAALLKYETPDSITKAFFILNGLLSCGRSSEIAFVVVEELTSVTGHTFKKKL